MLLAMLLEPLMHLWRILIRRLSSGQLTEQLVVNTPVLALLEKICLAIPSQNLYENRDIGTVLRGI